MMLTMFQMRPPRSMAASVLPLKKAGGARVRYGFYSRHGLNELFNHSTLVDASSMRDSVIAPDATREPMSSIVRSTRSSSCVV